jgi:hypothetical protein
VRADGTGGAGGAGGAGGTGGRSGLGTVLGLGATAAHLPALPFSARKMVSQRERVRTEQSGGAAAARPRPTRSVATSGKREIQHPMRLPGQRGGGGGGGGGGG